MTDSKSSPNPERSPQSALPVSGTLCYCHKCGELFRAWPNEPYCPSHRKPRVRLVNGQFVPVDIRCYRVVNT